MANSAAHSHNNTAVGFQALTKAASYLTVLL